MVANADGRPVALALEPELHYAEVVAVSPNARDVFESYQPTSVLSGQELSLKLEGSLGEMLKTEPGVANRSFGPGPSRPVIRGLDGDRVLILENGQRTDDLSSQSADHGVTISPLAAERVEVVRGPATLLYGANAIGGLVNVVTDIIPTKPVERTSGSVQVDLGSAAAEAGGAGDLTVGTGRFAVHVGGSARRTGDVSTPLADLENSQSRNAFGHVGASLTSDKGFVGGSYQFDDTKYGIPFVEEGNVQLTPRRHTVRRARPVQGPRPASSMRYAARSTSAAIGTTSSKATRSAPSSGTTPSTSSCLRRRGRWPDGSTALTASAATDAAFEAIGEEALSPPVDQRNVAAFTYQEAVWPHVTLQFGGRLEHASFSPEDGLPARDFTNLSGSAGVLFRPTDQTTLAVSVARAARNPALEELYFFGPHVGNFAFEIGNAALDSEKALGLDVSYRWRFARASGEVSVFRNAIDHFIFRNPTGDD